MVMAHAEVASPLVLWLFHAMMFVLWIALSVPAADAIGTGNWGAAAVWGGLAVLVLGVEVTVGRALPRWLGREPYDNSRGDDG